MHKERNFYAVYILGCQKITKNTKIILFFRKQFAALWIYFRYFLSFFGHYSCCCAKKSYLFVVIVNKFVVYRKHFLKFENKILETSVFSKLQRFKTEFYSLLFYIFLTFFHVVAGENRNAAPLSRLPSSSKFFTIVRPSSVFSRGEEHKKERMCQIKNEKILTNKRERPQPDIRTLQIHREQKTSTSNKK